MTGEGPGPVPFAANIELLRLYLACHDEIVERIQGVLNAQRKPVQYLQDGLLLSRDLDNCFLTLAAVRADQVRLRSQLEEVHWASGFRPRAIPGLHNDLVNPAEMSLRAFHFWQQTRWPGRNGRLRFAHTLFNLYVLRWLEFLSLRLWDAGPSAAADGLAEIQSVLDQLWRTTPGDQPVIVRDARWLIPLAQSPTTDELAAYFEVAEHVAEGLPPEDNIEVQKAAVPMIGGHLRSQIRHYCMNKSLSVNEHSVVLRTRRSNALDFALLIQGLVVLLEAYEVARRSGDDGRRVELAGAICQGISPDPEVFINRIDLLGPLSMIEHLFIATDQDGRASYTPMGLRHLRLLQEYEAQINRLATSLYEDCRRFRPLAGNYSPYGAIYGTPSNLTELIALKTLQPGAETGFGLEDAFADSEADAARLAWADGWRKMPHINQEVQSLYSYPQQFAEEIFQVIEKSLSSRGADGPTVGKYRTGRLFILTGQELSGESEAAQIPDLAVRFISSSDEQVVAAREAEFMDEVQLLRDRQEGHFVLSFKTAGGWIAISKDMLTDVLGAGKDVRIVGLPAAAAGVLRLMCPHQASIPPSTVKD